jgi:diguanylate cyclase (GGDEF)-like protein
VADKDRTETRIEALLARVGDADPELRAEIEWLVGRYRRGERNLEKISRMSDRMQAQILDLNDRLRVVSVTDALTGLTNRRGAQDALASETATANETGAEFSLILMDIDHFKKVNDTHGHDVGDEVLIDCARRLSGALRETDLATRWGGEEFLAILPETDLVSATKVLKGLHERLRGDPVDTAAGPLWITASSGLTRFIPGERGFEAALARADHALYAAKYAGRDRWVVAEEDADPPKRASGGVTKS